MADGVDDSPKVQFSIEFSQKGKTENLFPIFLEVFSRPEHKSNSAPTQRKVSLRLNSRVLPFEKGEGRESGKEVQFELERNGRKANSLGTCPIIQLPTCQALSNHYNNRSFHRGSTLLYSIGSNGNIRFQIPSSTCHPITANSTSTILNTNSCLSNQVEESSF